MKIEMWRGTDLPAHGYLVVKCHTRCVNIWVCSKDGVLSKMSEVDCYKIIDSSIDLAFLTAHCRLIGGPPGCAIHSFA
jgi:hypothetical protein